MADTKSAMCNTPKPWDVRILASSSSQLDSPFSCRNPPPELAGKDIKNYYPNHMVKYMYGVKSLIK